MVENDLFQVLISVEIQLYGWLDGYRLTENNQGQAQIVASGWHVTGNSNNSRYRYMKEL